MPPRKTALIRIENLIAKAEVDGPPVGTGLSLLRMLTGEYEVMFLTNAPTDRRSKVKEWLVGEAMVRQPKIFGPEHDDPIRVVRYLGYDPVLFIDPDPAMCAYAFQQGVTALLVCAPAYQRPEFRPDARGPATPWDQLIGDLSRQEQLRAADARTGEIDVERYGD